MPTLTPSVTFLPPADPTQPPVSPWVSGAVLAFDKPLGITSFQLVGRVRWLLTRALGGKKLKVGHAGTLDPLASGVMVLCTGRATKQIEQLQGGEKEYIATLRLGATTPSFDLEHPVDATFPTSHITLPMVEQVLRQFTGDIMQTPPIFSACKVAGKRAYDLARDGKEVALAPKPVHISSIDLLDCQLTGQPSLSLRVACSKGTYIRSLARDIGQALHSGAHLTALQRTRVGRYDLAQCFALDTFSPEQITQNL